MSRVLRAIAAVMLIAALGHTAHAQTADIVNYRGPDREQKLIEGAKKEGE